MPSHLHRRDEPGHTHFWTVSCYQRLTFFWHDAMKQVAVEGLRVLQERHGICLIAYVIMPEHVHAIVYPHAKGNDTPVPISQMWHAFKQHVGFHGKRCLQKLSMRDGKLWSEPLNAWNRGDLEKQIVMNTRGYDFNIDRQKTLIEKINYCHKNPITRGLVDIAEDWKWSSYRYYELGDASVLKMDWDGGWPIVW
jgi:putative transposase